MLLAASERLRSGIRLADEGILFSNLRIVNYAIGIAFGFWVWVMPLATCQGSAEQNSRTVRICLLVYGVANAIHRAYPYRSILYIPYAYLVLRTQVQNNLQNDLSSTMLYALLQGL